MVKLRWGGEDDNILRAPTVVRRGNVVRGSVVRYCDVVCRSHVVLRAGFVACRSRVWGCLQCCSGRRVLDVGEEIRERLHVRGIRPGWGDRRLEEFKIIKVKYQTKYKHENVNKMMGF